jgi:hypothetical protein
MDGLARMAGIGFIKRLLGGMDGEQPSVPHVQTAIGCAHAGSR